MTSARIHELDTEIKRLKEFDKKDLRRRPIGTYVPRNKNFYKIKALEARRDERLRAEQEELESQLLNIETEEWMIGYLKGLGEDVPEMLLKNAQRIKDRIATLHRPQIHESDEIKSVATAGDIQTPSGKRGKKQ